MYCILYFVFFTNPYPDNSNVLGDFLPELKLFLFEPFCGFDLGDRRGPGGPLTMCLLGLKCFSPLLQTWHKKMATGASFICTQNNENIYFYIYYLVFRTYLLYSASATYRGDYEYLALINWDRCKYNIYCVNCIVYNNILIQRDWWRSL